MPFFSKADLSSNWREAPSKPQKRQFPIAFAKKPVLVNPYPPQMGLWYDFTEFRSGLKCEICKTNIRKNIFPQQLVQCAHIFCAKCIHEHYTVKGNKTCPTCNTHIEYDDDDRYSDYSYHRNEDDSCHNCGYSNCVCGYEEDDECACGCAGCEGNCGTLRCGCIDVCRGRCGAYDYW